MNRSKKIFFSILIALAIIAVVVILFISPITKYVIEKYDTKYTGREIKMDWAYVNPFTGHFYFRNLKIYEFQSDSIFISASGASLNISLRKLLHKTFEVNELIFDNPKATITQERKIYNFTDLIQKFSSKDTSNLIKTVVRRNFPSIKITNGEIYYREKLIPVNVSIKNLTFESAEKLTTNDTFVSKFSFIPGEGSGNFKGDFNLNVKSKDYYLAAVINKLDLQVIQQYLKELSFYGKFRATLDADIKAKGNFSNGEKITATGMLGVNDFHFGKTSREDYASFKKLTIGINEISPENHKYVFDSILLNAPYLKYERYDYLNNAQMMFGKKGSKYYAAKADADKFNLILTIGRYVKILSRNFFSSYYKLNRLAISDGDLEFNDYHTSEKFAINFKPLNIIADSIDKNHARATVYFKSGIKPYGNGNIKLSINPKDSGDFDLNYQLQKLPASLFNPYVLSYTSFPLDRGTIEFNGKWKVRNSDIQSENHFVVIDPRVGKRVRNKDTKWLPAPLIMAFIRENGNVIDYDIPITGNLKNPKFHLQNVIWDLITNIFVKPVTIPYRHEVRSIENEIEKSLSLKWQMRNSVLQSNQKDFIAKMSDFLKKNPDATITVSPELYEEKEKEHILFFEAKKKYLLATSNINGAALSEEDSLKIDKMSVKDSVFVHFLNSRMKTSMLFTIQDKCKRYIGTKIINSKWNQLKVERVDVFLDYFKQKQVDKQIKIAASKSVIPFNGFSFYKIAYNGVLPEPLMKAYQQIDELNKEAPRKKFEKQRKKIFGLF